MAMIWIASYIGRGIPISEHSLASRYGCASKLKTETCIPSAFKPVSDDVVPRPERADAGSPTRVAWPSQRSLLPRQSPPQAESGRGRGVAGDHRSLRLDHLSLPIHPRKEPQQCQVPVTEPLFREVGKL